MKIIFFEYNVNVRMCWKGFGYYLIADRVTVMVFRVHGEAQQHAWNLN